MQNRPLRVGPVALTATLSTTILNTALSALAGPVGYVQTQPYAILTHIRVVNKSNASANVSLYIGATGASAAGTEFAFNAYPVGSFSYVDWYGRVRLESTDFLTGGASSVTALTFEAEGEVGLT
jgi:hypothetical protein